MMSGEDLAWLTNRFMNLFDNSSADLIDDYGIFQVFPLISTYQI